MTTKVDEAEFLNEMADQMGVACATVKDGHVIIFTKKHLEALLAQIIAKGTDKCVVFVKRQDLANAN